MTNLLLKTKTKTKARERERERGRERERERRAQTQAGNSENIFCSIFVPLFQFKVHRANCEQHSCLPEHVNMFI